MSCAPMQSRIPMNLGAYFASEDGEWPLHNEYFLSSQRRRRASNNQTIELYTHGLPPMSPAGFY